VVVKSTSIEDLRNAIDRAASLLAVRKADLIGKSDDDLDLASSRVMHEAIGHLISKLSGGEAVCNPAGPSPSGWSEQETNSDYREPDFDYYANLEIWGVREAVALASGFDPNFVPMDEHGPLLDWAQSAVQAGQLRDPVSPLDFLSWMKRWGYPVDRRLVEAVRRNEQRYGSGYLCRDEAANPSPKIERKSDATNKMKSTQQLLVFFAFKAGYIEMGRSAPELNRAAEIEKDMEGLSIKMSRATIERRFRDAARSVWSEFFSR
jgi:hypothetical protein